MARDVDARMLPADPTEDLHAVTKQYCDANVAGGGIAWEEETTTAGVNKTGQGAGPDAERFTTKFYVSQPLRVQYLLIDLPGEGEYTVTLDTHAGTRGTDDIYPWLTIAESVVITEEEAELTFGVDTEVYPDNGEFVLLPGPYFLTVEKTGEGMVQDFDAYVFRADYEPTVYYPLGTELWGATPGESYGDAEATAGTCLPFSICAYKGLWVV